MQRIAAAACFRAAAITPAAGQPATATAIAALQVVGPIADRSSARTAPGLLAITRSLESTASSCWAPPPVASAAAQLPWQPGDVRPQPPCPLARLRSSSEGRTALQQGGFCSSTVAPCQQHSGRPGHCWHAHSAAAAPAALPGYGSTCCRSGSGAQEAIHTRCARTACSQGSGFRREGHRPCPPPHSTAGRDAS